jgi:general secretion pathway protein N
MKRAAGLVVLAGTLAGLANPQFYESSFASINAEVVSPDENREAQADARAPAAEAAPTGNPLWAIPFSKLSATRDRPLFSPSRRPRVPAVAAAPAPAPVAVVRPAPPETPSLILVGTIISAASRIAILFDQASGTTTDVREGERASGWTLRSVESRSAVVEGNSRAVTIDLPEPSAQASPATAPVSGAAPRAGGVLPSYTGPVPGPAALQNPAPAGSRAAPRKRRFSPDNPGAL